MGSDSYPFQRLLEVPLPDGGYVLTLFEAYFDESGCDDYSRVLCVAGYLIRSDYAKTMDFKWKAILDEYQLPYFHMVDCAHGNPPFKHLSKAQRSEVAEKLIGLIKRYVYLGYASIVNPKRFVESQTIPDPYTLCIDAAMLFALRGPKMSGSDRRVAIFFEAGHENGPKADRWIKTNGNLEMPVYLSHTFARKQDVRLLQAADLLAWQVTKYIKNKVFSARPPRRDFLNLMKTRHTFMYLTMQPGVSRELKLDHQPTKHNLKMDAWIKAMFSEGDEHDAMLKALTGEPTAEFLKKRGWKL